MINNDQSCQLVVLWLKELFLGWKQYLTSFHPIFPFFMLDVCFIVSYIICPCTANWLKFFFPSFGKSTIWFREPSEATQQSWHDLKSCQFSFHLHECSLLQIRLAEAQQQKTHQQDNKSEQLDKLTKLEGWHKELKLLEDKKKAELTASWMRVCVSIKKPCFPFSFFHLCFSDKDMNAEF